MNDSIVHPGSAALVIGAALVLVLLALLFFWHRGRPLAGAHVFRASRLSRGNLLFPTQVAVTSPLPSSHGHPTICTVT